MSIGVDVSGRRAHLSGGGVSYVLEVADTGHVIHRYFGPAIRRYEGIGEVAYHKRGYTTEHDSAVPNLSFDDFPFEYPSRGRGDFRTPALTVHHGSGARLVDPTFRGWSVLTGKPPVPGLPAAQDRTGQARTLEVVCADDVAGLKVTHYYTLFDDCGVIARRQVLENTGTQELVIEGALSLSLELPAGQYDVMSVYGSHAKEGNSQRHPIHHGIHRIESSRGVSSHQHQPFLAIMEPDAGWDSGRVYACQLLYSGDFLAQAECDQFSSVRLQIGINPDTFTWIIGPGDRFSTPEAVACVSDNGLNGMSHALHSLHRNHVLPAGDGSPPSILLNSWEAMTYDVSLPKIDRQTDIARDLGIEMFVLDDGWFRDWNSSTAPIGDWSPAEEKIPGGVEAVAELVHSKGMRFGLWFEPEAVSRNSRLFAAHPEWALHVPGYFAVEGRHELLLDLSRSDVQDHLIAVLRGFLAGGIDYIKWDMNRPLTDVCSTAWPARRQGEVPHRYVLGLYRVLATITREFPRLVVEGCSSGGGRFDPGMLCYCPQIWGSDNTDAYDRVAIQSGLGMLYPNIAIGAHVSEVPNQQTGRMTSLETRFDVARLFNLGYELDLERCTREELEEMRRQIAEYRASREWVQRGTFRQHRTPDDNHVMWSVVAPGAERAVAIIVRRLYDPLRSRGRFRFRGLRPDWVYRDRRTGAVAGGDAWMGVGATIPLERRDFAATAIELERCE